MCSFASSVTRFGEISSLWQNFTSFWQILTVYFLFGKILSLLWKIWYTVGLIFIVANAKILKNNLIIWSHCLLPQQSTLLLFETDPKRFALEMRVPDSDHSLSLIHLLDDLGTSGLKLFWMQVTSKT